MLLSATYKEVLEAKELVLSKQADLLRKIGLDDIKAMLSAGKRTLKGFESPMGISRPPIFGLNRSIGRASVLGATLSDIEELTHKANLNKGSIAKTYKGLFDSKSDTNPLQLLTQARNKAYSSANNLKKLSEAEIEESIFRSLARQGSNPQVESYAQHLVNTRGAKNSELSTHVKKIADDFIEGRDPVLLIKNGKGQGKNLNLTIDRPFASYNGSPVINTKKVMGIDGIESFNKKHIDLEQKYQRALLNANGASTDELIEAADKYQRSQAFNNVFGDKLREMSSSPDIVNKAKFTLDDLDTVEKAKTFLKNPFVDNAHKLMDDYTRENITNSIIGHISKNPNDVKKGLSEALDQVAQNPNTANYMQSFQFERYSAEDMKNVMETLKGTKRRLLDERTRAVADALGAAGLAGVLGTGAYTAFKGPDTKMLHNSDERLQYNPNGQNY